MREYSTACFDWTDHFSWNSKNTEANRSRFILLICYALMLKKPLLLDENKHIYECKMKIQTEKIQEKKICVLMKTNVFAEMYKKDVSWRYSSSHFALNSHRHTHTCKHSAKWKYSISIRTKKMW